MSSTDDEFRHESIQDTESIVEYLYALMEGFQNKKILFGTTKKKLILLPNGLLRLAVRAKRKDKDVKVSLKISWSEGIDSKTLKNELLEIKAGKKE